MKFDDIDKVMRVYEQSIDQYIAPNTYIVARIDGRSFTKLTKDICKFEVPFDIKFRDMMVNTVKHLMNCGFRVIYGFTESDEISLLFHIDENTFGRKVRKYNSILAGEASSSFSLQLGKIAVFDCRLIPLPNKEIVEDYFLWRQEDAHRNALNAHCYWTLRRNNKSVQNATKELEGKSLSYKNELLFSNGINFNDLPNWQKRGIGLYWIQTQKEGVNPITNKKEIAIRKNLNIDYNLPLKNDYAIFIENILDSYCNCCKTKS